MKILEEEENEINQDLLDYVLEGEWISLVGGKYKNLYARGLICNDGDRVVVISEITQEVDEEGKEDDIVSLKDVIPFDDFSQMYPTVKVEWAGVFH